MKQILTITLGLAALSVAWQASAQVTLYEREGLHGQVFTADRSVSDLERYGFNDRASSAIVQRGQWQVCEHANFEGSCTILRPGQYPSLAAMGMNDRISSLRKVQGSSKHAYAPAPPVAARIPTIRSMVKGCTRPTSWPCAPSSGRPSSAAGWNNSRSSRAIA
jgi:hypothetical protein